MGRQTLRITIVLGMLVTLLGGTGIFATFTDRATAGDNTVTSGERPRVADLKIAAFDPALFPAGTTACMPGTVDFTDDTTTGQFSAASIQPGDQLPVATLCLQNAGSGNLDITASAIDLVDTDVACTGDELAAGDTTCGVDETTGLPQAGELSSVLHVRIDRVDCSDAGTILGSSSETALEFYTTQLLHLDLTPTPGPLTAQEIACLAVRVWYPTTTDTDAQIAQSDSSTWKFAFDATAQ
jgi:predicted ribosomally synthesized peptide with SipW-like signal peptide